MLDDLGFWSSCQGQEIYLSKMSRPIPGSPRLSTWFVWGFFPWGTVIRVWGLPLTAILCRGYEVKNNSLYAFMVCIGTPLSFNFVLSWKWWGRMINPLKYFCAMSPKGSLLFAVILTQQWSFLTIYILCFLSLSNCFYFSEAENIQELSCNLNVKQRELTAVETNRRHQKEALRKREEDLRGTSKNLIAVTFGLNFFIEKW
jgi:hypothetical protein